MATMIFVNLPVKDLAKSREFFGRLGYAFDDTFSDDNAACLVISDTIRAMLLVEPFFQTFTKKQIADSGTTEVLVGLSAESKEHVDELVDRALAAGATVANDTNDQGFMYGRSFEDLDGHIWEVMWMDPKALAA